MNLVFLFMSHKMADKGDYDLHYEPSGPCGDHYQKVFKDEGYFSLLRELKIRGIIENLYIFFESGQEPGIASWVSEANCQVIPNISLVEKYIDDDTIIFVRGGFRHWHNWLLQYKNKNWLMVYAANTGREKWPWWDIVLNDLQLKSEIDSNDRYQFHFIKPINQTTFKPHYMINPTYDLCIGASHIHDKKGQWRAVKVLMAYKKLFGIDLKAVMPGSYRRSEKTLNMLQNDLKEVDVICPGMLNRSDLCKLFNSCKLFMHLGAHGQNDRGPLEALACGTKIILGSPKYHAAELAYLSDIVKVPVDLDDFEGIAHQLHDLLSTWTPFDKKLTFDQFDRVLGITSCFQRFSKLLLLMEASHEISPESKKRILSGFSFLEEINN